MLLQEAIPSLTPLPAISDIFVEQERLSTSMAGHLESLSSHYDQMTMALQDAEAGMEIGEEDLRGTCPLMYRMLVSNLTR